MKKKKILVADDEAFIREVLTHALQPGYRVITAENGARAMEMTKKEKPDLIILDVDMPVMNGIDFMIALRNNPNAEYSSIPVIMLTQLGRISEVETGFSAGADLYLPKPFNLTRLTGKIKSLLE